MKSNPWLGGSLKKSFGKGVHLVYNDINIDELLFLNPDGLKIHSKLSYTEITALAEEYIVKSPKDILNTDLKVCSLILNQTSENNFSMIFSVSHSVVDGHSYYQLLNMFSKDKTIESLSIERKFEMEPKIKNAVGFDAYKYFVGIPHIV